MSWTEGKSTNAWLALDRNGDGKITSLADLFGSTTPQPKSASPNGYRALAVFDDPSNGGNGNGLIDPGDAVFPHLLLWVDSNHNGVSETNELHTLPELGVFRIDLEYVDSRYVDANGNIFSRKWNLLGSEEWLCTPPE